MENTSARPYFAIFAIVAIVVAGFILKQQIAGAAQPTADGGFDVSSPERQLVEEKGGRVPEAIPVWFKRVGYAKLGFASEQQMKDTESMLAAGGRRGPALTDAHKKTIHELMKMEGTPRKIGLDGMTKLQSTEDRKEFLPEVKSLFIAGSPNQHFRMILVRWASSGDMDLVKQFAKDPDPKLAEFAQGVVDDVEFPGKDM